MSEVERSSSPPSPSDLPSARPSPGCRVHHTPSLRVGPCWTFTSYRFRRPCPGARRGPLAPAHPTFRPSQRFPRGRLIIAQFPRDLTTGTDSFSSTPPCYTAFVLLSQKAAAREFLHWPPATSRAALKNRKGALTKLLSGETRGRILRRSTAAKAAFALAGLMVSSLALLAAQAPNSSSPAPPQSVAPPAATVVQSAEMQEEASFKAILDATDPDQKIRLAQDFLANYPASRFAGPVSDRLVEAYYSKKDWPDFYATATATLAKNPDDVYILVLTGWVITHLYDPNDSEAAGKLNQAENDLKHAIQIIPALPKPAGLTDEQFAASKTTEMSRAHTGLGLVYFRRRDFGNSVSELQLAALGAASPDPTGLWALGVGLRQLKRYAEAADAFEKCGQLPGDLQDPCKQLARQTEKARNRESMWSPPDVDTPLKSISAAQTCSLPNVLAHAGVRAQELVDNLQRFAAEETIEYQELDSVGTVVGAETATYDYLVTFQHRSDAFSIDESRQVSAGRKGLTGGSPDRGLPSLALIFHPYYQGDYDMRCEGLADWQGTPAWVVHFVQRKDKPKRMSAVPTSRGAVPANLKGRAWIAADSYQVLHIEADLAEPLLAQRVYRDAVSINYAPVEFHAQNVQLWLPLSAESFTESADSLWDIHRSVVEHTFADFVLFSVHSNQAVDPQHQH